MITKLIFTGWAGMCLCAFQMGAAAQQFADRIFTSSGNSILTMTDNSQTNNIVRVGGLAIAGGKIIGIGTAAEVMKFNGTNTLVTDLGEHALLPGFVDAHSHLLLTAGFLPFAEIRSYPLSPITNLSSVYLAVNTWAATNGGGLGKQKWLIGFGFDPSNFPADPSLTYGQSGFPTRLDLDQVYPNQPVAFIHYSGHIAVANSLALKLAKLDNTTNDSDVLLYSNTTNIPTAYQGKPNGILLENGVISLGKAFPTNPGQLLSSLARAQQQFAMQGITTTQEGNASVSELLILKVAALLKKFDLDVVAYLRFRSMPQLERDIEFLKRAPWSGKGEYHEGLRFGGIKMVLDGTPPGETAWVSEPYETYFGLQTITNATDYTGVQDFPNSADVYAATRYAYTNQIQLMAHVNGDAALAQFLAAVQLVATNDVASHRTVAIHSQIAQQSQIQSMNNLGIIPSFFPDHIYYFGQLYNSRALGTNRAQNICATAWAKQANLRFTLHNDTPVFPNNMLRAVWAAVNRLTFDYGAKTDGYVLGPAQRISVVDALKAITINAAYQYGEEDQKGTLAIGKRADLVILSKDPTAVPSMDLLTLSVLETIKDGNTIYPTKGEN